MSDQPKPEPVVIPAYLGLYDRPSPGELLSLVEADRRERDRAERDLDRLAKLAAGHPVWTGEDARENLWNCDGTVTDWKDLLAAECVAMLKALKSAQEKPDVA